MNYSKQHSSDEMIERELQGLRQPLASTYGLGDAIRTMQAEPAIRPRRLNWPVGIAMAVVAGTAILIGSLTPGRALADELHTIASAQQHQSRKYMKAFLYGGQKKPQRVYELWTDHEKEAYRQFDRDGRLQVAITSDGKRNYRYFADTGGLMPATALIDKDRSEHFGIETIDALLQSDFFRKHKIEKKGGVKLNGRVCDYYSFANGYCRVWVDPATRLPLQREIYDRGVTLWERNVYQYPKLFSATTFEPLQIPGMPYFDYIAARQELRAKLATRGQSQQVEGVTITLKAVVKDGRYVRPIWSTTGVDGPQEPVARLEISNAERAGGFSGLPTEAVAPGQKLINDALAFDKAFKLPATVRIAAYEADPAKKGQARFVGWASFRVDEVLTVPSANQLMRTFSKENEPAKATATGTGS